jgi:hypothetical protein
MGIKLEWTKAKRLAMLSEMKADIVKDFKRYESYNLEQYKTKRKAMNVVSSFGLCTTFNSSTVARVFGVEGYDYNTHDDVNLEDVHGAYRDFQGWFAEQQPTEGCDFYEEVAGFSYWWNNNSPLRIDFLYNLIRNER